LGLRSLVGGVDNLGSIWIEDNEHGVEGRIFDTVQRLTSLDDPRICLSTARLVPGVFLGERQLVPLLERGSDDRLRSLLHVCLDPLET
jgi:hypothetical protein